VNKYLQHIWPFIGVFIVLMVLAFTQIDLLDAVLILVAMLLGALILREYTQYATYAKIVRLPVNDIFTLIMKRRDETEHVSDRMWQLIAPQISQIVARENADLYRVSDLVLFRVYVIDKLNNVIYLGPGDRDTVHRFAYLGGRPTGESSQISLSPSDTLARVSRYN